MQKTIPAQWRKNPVGRTRSSRTSRLPKKIPLRVQERDVWILEGLGKMRFLTTSHLAYLFFHGLKEMATKRLRKLFDAGLIRVWVRDLTKENIYSLECAGVRVLEERDTNTHSYTVVRALDGNLDHLLGINTVRVSLACTLPDVGGELTSWHSDWEISRKNSGGLVPDAEFVIEWNAHQTQSFRLELDMNSRSLKGLLKKIFRYDARRIPFVVLVVGKNQSWVYRYRATLRNLHMSSMVWFTTLAAIEEKGAVNRIWNHTKDEKNHALRECLTVRQ